MIYIFIFPPDRTCEITRCPGGKQLGAVGESQRRRELRGMREVEVEVEKEEKDKEQKREGG